MVFIFILIFPLIYSYKKYEHKCIVYNKITTERLKIYNDDYCVYLDTEELDLNKEVIEVKFIVYGTIMVSGFMYYEGTNNKPIINTYVNLSNELRYSDYDETRGDSHNSYFYYCSYIFKVPKLKERYIYLSIPSFSSSSSNYAEIFINNELSLLAIALISIGILIIIALIMIIIYNFSKNRKRKNNLPESNLSADSSLVPPENQPFPVPEYPSST